MQRQEYVQQVPSKIFKYIKESNSQCMPQYRRH